MAVINTNYLSMVAQNNLNKSQSSLGTAIERLSSGLRINSAKDDAAGQAIANRFTANVNGLTQAARNANDGISIAQTTEGALNEINNNLQRIRQLTVQASTGTNSDSDLASIQAEVQQRLDEITRVSEQTQFNGVKVLAKNDTLKIQVGANDNEVISINLKQIDAQTLGLADLTLTKPFDTTNVGATAVTEGRVGAAVNITAAADTNTTALDAEGVFALKDGSGYVVKANDGKYYAGTVSTGTGDATVAWDSTGGTNEVAATDVDTSAPVTRVKEEVTFTLPTTGAPAGLEVREVTGDDKRSYVLTDSAGKFYEAKFDKDGNVSVGVELSTKLETIDPLAAIDQALSDVDNLRSDLGAVQNRFESTVANLNNTINNLSAARSRIEDADYATEVSNMTKAQILQQAGTSVLAQANQVPQTVLSLLR